MDEGSVCCGGKKYFVLEMKRSWHTVLVEQKDVAGHVHPSFMA